MRLEAWVRGLQTEDVSRGNIGQLDEEVVVTNGLRGILRA